MISSLNKNINLNIYKECNEQFIYGIKGILRLSIGREIMYHMFSTFNYTFANDIPHICKIESIFAVTDKRIILIPLDSKYEEISFSYADIGVDYYDQLFDKVFSLDIKDKKVMNLWEDNLIFRVYSSQNKELNKINCILQEYAN